MTTSDLPNGQANGHAKVKKPAQTFDVDAVLQTLTPVSSVGSSSECLR